MNTPGFTAESSLYRTVRHFHSLPNRGESRRNNEVISQMTRDEAEETRRNMGGAGTVRCFYHCLQWDVCGYDPNFHMCCNNWGESCYWYPY